MKRPDSHIYRNDHASEREFFQRIRRQDCSEFCKESGQMYMDTPEPEEEKKAEPKQKYKYKGW